MSEIILITFLSILSIAFSLELSRFKGSVEKKLDQLDDRLCSLIDPLEDIQTHIRRNMQ